MKKIKRGMNPLDALKLMGDSPTEFLPPVARLGDSVQVSGDGTGAVTSSQQRWIVPVQLNGQEHLLLVEGLDAEAASKMRSALLLGDVACLESGRVTVLL